MQARNQSATSTDGEWWFARHVRRLRRLGKALLMLGFMGWFGGVALVIIQPGWVTQNMELPLGDLGAVAVDSQGRIYCGAQYYGRVQLYDGQGRFLRGWWVETAGGAMQFRFGLGSGDERLEVLSVRRDQVFVFDPNGRLIDSRGESEPDWNRFARTDQLVTTGPDGARYEAVGTIIWPRVVRQDADGRTIVVSTPWYLWPVMGPLPAWAFAFFGVLMWGFSRYYDKWVRRKPTQDAQGHVPDTKSRCHAARSLFG